MLKWRGLLVVSAALSCSIAQAVDGNYLYQQCATYNKRQNMSDGQALDFMGCHQYVAAVVDLLAMAPTLGGVKVCMPPNIQYDQAVDLTQAYLRDHPELRHDSAAVSVVVAMAQAFPCGK